METKCPICTTDGTVVAQLTVGKLLKCSSCQWLFSQDVPIKFVEKSNLNEKKRDEYLAIVQKASMYSELSRGDKVLDINSGDGSLLGWYLKNVVTVGVESNLDLMKEAIKQKRIDIPVPEKFSALAVKKAYKVACKYELKFKIITVVDTLQDLNPLPLLIDCKTLLGDDGVLVIQVPHFYKLFREKDFPLYQHYFLTYTLRTMMQKVGLELQGAELINQDIRVYITHPNNRRFAICDFQEKLKLYTTLNAAFIQDLQSRFDNDVTYKILESRLHITSRETCNDVSTPLSPVA